MNDKIIYAIIFSTLFLVGIFILTLTEIFSETWLIGLAMVGIAIALIIALTIKKFR